MAMSLVVTARARYVGWDPGLLYAIRFARASFPLNHTYTTLAHNTVSTLHLRLGKVAHVRHAQEIRHKSRLLGGAAYMGWGREMPPLPLFL